MRIWYTWVESRKACRESGIVLYSIFITYIEYSTFVEYSTYILCFAWSILPVLKPQKDDVPLILLSSIGGTRIWEIFRGEIRKTFFAFIFWLLRYNMNDTHTLDIHDARVLVNCCWLGWCLAREFVKNCFERNSQHLIRKTL